MTINVIHSCDAFLVVDKPAGLLSVPGKADDHKDCVESRMQALDPQARIVHRLDLATSGVMIMARSAKAHRHLGLQFERRHTAKTYQARLWGKAEGESGEIDLPLRCDWPNRPMQMVDHDLGKNAVTQWRVTQREESGGVHFTRVELTPITGRSHQLRVHMLALGYPIVGDRLYAPDGAVAASDRLQLHAASLTLHHPDGGERVTFESACPF